MNNARSWQQYAPTYRARELGIVAGWIKAGDSGTVAGLSGAGKSNFLNFLCYRPEVVRSLLPPGTGPVILVPVDINTLPRHDLATFHRLILQAFDDILTETAADVEPGLAQAVGQIYRDHLRERDPFVTQSALREVVWLVQQRQGRVVLVLDRFDHFFQMATPAIFNSLRGLRDRFKGMLSYIVGMRYEVAYLPDPAGLGEMRELIDRRVCWIGAMAEADARRMIAEEIAHADSPPAEEELRHMLALSGGYPALLKALCSWWLETAQKPAPESWLDQLQTEPSLAYRLQAIWAGLTEAEKLALSEVVQSQDEAANSGSERYRLDHLHRPALQRLEARRLCRPTETGWRLNSALLAAFIARLSGQNSTARGEIWKDGTTAEFYQGATTLSLEPQEKALLDYLLAETRRPGQLHPRSELMYALWPEEVALEVGNDTRLEQAISKLRKKIEPESGRFRYIVTYRGRGYREGGYQFYPEGKQADAS